MRKLSEINERLFNGGVQRASSDKDRLEDKLNWNIDEIEEVNFKSLPFVFADNVLEMPDEQHKDVFSKEKLQALLPHIERAGWRLPKEEDFMGKIIEKNYKLKDPFYMFTDFKYIKLSDGKTRLYVDVNTTVAPQMTWAQDDKVILFCADACEDPNTIAVQKYRDFYGYPKILLVKDKK